PVMSALELESYGLSWRHAPDVLAHLLPDDRAAVLNRDPYRTAASLDAFAPGDGQRWLAAYGGWLEVADSMLKTLFSPFPPIRGGLAVLRQLGVARALRLVRRSALSVRRLVEELFEG